MPDAVIIGAGWIGMLCARELRSRGMTVTVVDRDRPGRQASWASAGILSIPSPSDRTAHGELLRDSHRRYPELLEALREESGVDPEATYPGHLVPAFTDEDARELPAYATWERQRGYDSTYLDARELREVEPGCGPAIRGALLRPGGQVDNRRLCRAIEVANQRAGVDTRIGTIVTDVIRDRDRAVGVRTLDGDILANVVINAAGSWSAQIRGCDPLPPVVPQRGEIMALDQSRIGLKRVFMKPEDPYMVPRADGRLVIGATRKYVGYDSSFTAEGMTWLLNQAIEMVPALAGAPIAESWTGFRPVSADGIPMLGPSLIDGLYYATGHGPSGIAPGPGSAALVASLIAGEAPTIDARPYDPRRFAGWSEPLDPSGWGERGGSPNDPSPKKHRVPLDTSGRTE
jgi:glycine oxidase